MLEPLDAANLPISVSLPSGCLDTPVMSFSELLEQPMSYDFLPNNSLDSGRESFTSTGSAQSSPTSPLTSPAEQTASPTLPEAQVSLSQQQTPATSSAQSHYPQEFYPQYVPQPDVYLYPQSYLPVQNQQYQQYHPEMTTNYSNTAAFYPQIPKSTQLAPEQGFTGNFSSHLPSNVPPPGTRLSRKSPKKKKKKDPNEPSRPVSAYALFFRETQSLIKGQKPEATFGEISKIVASMWDALGDEEKTVYKQKTENAKRNYLRELASYRASLVSTSNGQQQQHSVRAKPY
ncbi:Oidioi.mRNA.OKI2018_I69.chr2.g7342.t1.cds [Oikopleura dioica]|uniref:Oidioi.mRNA.OKI2018_I69.chr2.g7342.t1.cds n=1 Tax=Oikopleura dioica TaxID=34765 RepID=A0ABN7TAK6_OIKDI|nr:Oidioi.mRNA.OKI2018_I69.chr2.g7342.t1.cds [Oikopleura dioica]